jgi:hypothetical protein
MGVEAQQRGEQFVEVGATDGDPVLVAKLGVCVEAQLLDAHGSNSSVTEAGRTMRTRLMPTHPVSRCR